MSYHIHQGDALAVLRTMPSESVDCCITSPPYYGLRDYGVADQIGLEPTPDAYIARLVEVFREVRRVLRAEGTLWVNIGDSYASQGGDLNKRKPGFSCTGHQSVVQSNGATPGNRTPPVGLKPKDLIGIPWLLAFALRNDGWWLRQDIIWHKPNPMPEGVKDRCTKAHEYIFMFSKSARYWWDAGAVAEPFADERMGNPSGGGQYARDAFAFAGPSSQSGLQKGQWNTDGSKNGRNKRSVWTLATLPTPDAHFATFPIELPETCLRAGCPEGGLVLDPFSGAGTTGLACLKNGRRYVGIELNPDYIEIAYNRARRHYPLLVSGNTFGCDTKSSIAVAESRSR